MPDSLHGVEGIACYDNKEVPDSSGAAAWADGSGTGRPDYDSSNWLEDAAAAPPADESAAGTPPAADPPGAAAAPAPVKSLRQLSLLLGERGGAVPYSSTTIFKCKLVLDTYTCSEAEPSEYRAERPSSYSNVYSPWLQPCTDMYLDAANQLWIAACVDPGPFGPFRSYVYYAGTVTPDDEYSRSYYSPASFVWYIDSLCVRAVARACLPGSVLSIASSDKAFGGIWRPLAPSTSY
jgi:hypothetical protein